MSTFDFNRLGNTQQKRLRELAQKTHSRGEYTIAEWLRAVHSLYRKHYSKGLTTKKGGPCKLESKCFKCGAKTDLRFKRTFTSVSLVYHVCATLCKGRHYG